MFLVALTSLMTLTLDLWSCYICKVTHQDHIYNSSENKTNPSNGRERAWSYTDEHTHTHTHTHIHTHTLSKNCFFAAFSAFSAFPAFFAFCHRWAVFYQNDKTMGIAFMKIDTNRAHPQWQTKYVTLIAFHFISLFFTFHFISFHFISFHFISFSFFPFSQIRLLIKCLSLLTCFLLLLPLFHSQGF